MLDTYTASVCMESQGRSNFARAMIYLQAYVELKDTLVVAVPKIKDQCPKKVVSDVKVKKLRQVVRGLPVGPKSRVVYKPVQPTTAMKSDTRQAKQKDSTSGSKTMANPSGTKRNYHVAK
ncbi:hypothetical protein Tco_0360761 [Tanacetum coccineum]